VKSTKEDHGKHPTQKPIALMEALIKLTTQEEQIVLDPFCGSGSTLVATKKLNRNYIGIEFNKEFCDIANERLNNLKYLLLLLLLLLLLFKNQKNKENVCL
jgi:site-specific DNA-methyltransferase (adenine-specific)